MNINDDVFAENIICHIVSKSALRAGMGERQKVRFDAFKIKRKTNDYLQIKL